MAYSNNVFDCSIQVWPALAVIGGVDNGLRIGGRCVHKLTAKKGTVLGVLKHKATNVKVQWDESDTTVGYALFQYSIPSFNKNYHGHLKPIKNQLE